MSVTLVRVGNFYVGKTVSDRWNLASLNIKSIPVERNQSTLKRLRRLNPDFAFSVARQAGIQLQPTPSEVAAFGPTMPLTLTRLAA